MGALLDEIARLKREGVPKRDFDMAKKLVYGRLATHYDSVDDIANGLAGCFFAGMAPFDIVEAAAAVTQEDVAQALLEGFDENRAAMSVIQPIEG